MLKEQQKQDYLKKDKTVKQKYLTGIKTDSILSYVNGGMKYGSKN